MSADIIPIKSGVKKLMGQTKPRVMSIPLKGKSHGPAFAEFAAKCGKPLYPWQEYCANDFLTYDDEGMFIRKTIGLIISRQNGKTWEIALRILFGLTFLGEKSCVAMSSVRDMAEDTFEDVCQLIEQNQFLLDQVKLTARGKVGKFGNGAFVLDFKNGARYEVVAATASGPRGKSADLLFVDELRDIDEDAWSAAKPTTTSRANAQTFTTSNAGTAFSTILNDLRLKATSYPKPSLGWYEYSADPAYKIDDKRGWAQANPSLGYGITEATLQEFRDTLPPDIFRMEHLCQWISSDVSPWPEGGWESCGDSTLTLPIGPQTYFSFDVAQSRRSAKLLGGQRLANGKLGVGVIAHWSADVAVDDLKIAVDIKAWADKYQPVETYFDKYATASIAKRLETSGVRVFDVSGQASYTAAGDLLDAIVGNRVVHANQDSLNNEMNACAMLVKEGGWRIVRRKSAGDVSGPIALSMLVHKMYEPAAIPMIY